MEVVENLQIYRRQLAWEMHIRRPFRFVAAWGPWHYPRCGAPAHIYRRQLAWGCTFGAVALHCPGRRRQFSWETPIRHPFRSVVAGCPSATIGGGPRSQSVGAGFKPALRRWISLRCQTDLPLTPPPIDDRAHYACIKEKGAQEGDSPVFTNQGRFAVKNHRRRYAPSQA